MNSKPDFKDGDIIRFSPDTPNSYYAGRVFKVISVYNSTYKLQDLATPIPKKLRVVTDVRGTNDHATRLDNEAEITWYLL